MFIAPTLRDVFVAEGLENGSINASRMGLVTTLNASTHVLLAEITFESPATLRHFLDVGYGFHEGHVGDGAIHIRTEDTGMKDDGVGVFTITIVAYSTLSVGFIGRSARLSVDCCGRTRAWPCDLSVSRIWFGDLLLKGIIFTLNLSHGDLKQGGLDGLSLFLLAMSIVHLEPSFILFIHVVLHVEDYRRPGVFDLDVFWYIEAVAFLVANVGHGLIDVEAFLGVVRRKGQDARSWRLALDWSLHRHKRGYWRGHIVLGQECVDVPAIYMVGCEQSKALVNIEVRMKLFPASFFSWFVSIASLACGGCSCGAAVTGSGGCSWSAISIAISVSARACGWRRAANSSWTRYIPIVVISSQV
ncbi:hypothetical protein KCU65_g199, partial [Aureobasidium melanogenum]